MIDSSRGRIAAEYLMRARDDFTRAERTRSAYARQFHEHGMSYGDIGTWLGVSEVEAQTIAGEP